jgi:hypothetical protein
MSEPEKTEIEDERKWSNWLWALGIGLSILGAFFKIQHLPYADYLLLIGLSFSASSIAVDFYFEKNRSWKNYLKLSRIYFFILPAVALFDRELFKYLMPICIVLVFLNLISFIYEVFFEKEIKS